MGFNEDFHLVEKGADGIEEWQHHAGRGTPANPQCFYLVYKSTWYEPGTPRDLILVLSRYIHASVRLRWWYGSYAKNEVTDDECDVNGLLGRSGGYIKIPIVLANRTSSGGSAILTDFMRAVMGPNKRLLWQDDKFQLPRYDLQPVNIQPDPPRYTGPVLRVGAFRNGENVANFPHQEQAERWVAFMEGRRMTP